MYKLVFKNTQTGDEWEGEPILKSYEVAVLWAEESRAKYPHIICDVKYSPKQ